MRTAIAPSPTAETTRLTNPLRTSPTANTPGRLVSSLSGHQAPPGRHGYAGTCPRLRLRDTVIPSNTESTSVPAWQQRWRY